MKIKAIIFDMDGVLIDARDWHYESLNRALSLFGTEISRYDHLITFDGLPTKKKLEMLTLEKGFPKKLHSFVNELKQQYTMEIIASKCKPVFQQQYALSQLTHLGYKVAVCSNSIKKTIEEMMDKAALSKYLEFILSNQDVKHGKPSPEIYLKAIDKLGFKDTECLIIEDNENGIKAAIDSGAFIMKVDSPKDVSIENILLRINEIENA
jgi:beta-phosphoglucomutase